MIKRNDVILIVVIIFLCLGVVAFQKLTQKEGSRVVITVNGEVYDTLELQEDTVYTVKIKDSYNTFQIKDGYVDMIDASCPDQLCVRQADIHYNHETIVCLPNRVVIEVMGTQENDVDMIAR